MPLPRRAEPERCGLHVVRWDEQDDDGLHVPVEYGCCGRKVARTTHAAGWLRKTPTAVCHACANRGPRSNRWRGGVFVDSHGYRFLSFGGLDSGRRAMAEQMVTPARTNRKIAEHRLVMAEALGRPLQRWEEVHHINGDKSDNRIGNLQLVSRAEHTRSHQGVMAALAAAQERIRQLEAELAAVKVAP